jgi:hypothetical protein
MYWISCAHARPRKAVARPRGFRDNPVGQYSVIPRRAFGWRINFLFGWSAAFRILFTAHSEGVKRCCATKGHAARAFYRFPQAPPRMFRVGLPLPSGSCRVLVGESDFETSSQPHVYTDLRAG